MTHPIDNLQCIRLPVPRGSTSAYLPTATGLDGVEVHRLLWYNPASPLATDSDGSPVLSAASAPQLEACLDLKGEGRDTPVRNLPLRLLDAACRDTLVPLHRRLRWEASSVKLAGTHPGGTPVLLLYAAHGSTGRPAGPPRSVVQVQVPQGARRKLSPYVDTQGYGWLRGVECLTAGPLAGAAFLTLNCRSGRTFNHVPLAFLQSADGTPRIHGALRLADYNVDWNNSYIENTACPVRLNLYFG